MICYSVSGSTLVDGMCNVCGAMWGGIVIFNLGDETCAAWTTLKKEWQKSISIVATSPGHLNWRKAVFKEYYLYYYYVYSQQHTDTKIKPDTQRIALILAAAPPLSVLHLLMNWCRLPGSWQLKIEHFILGAKQSLTLYGISCLYRPILPNLNKKTRFRTIIITGWQTLCCWHVGSLCGFSVWVLCVPSNFSLCLCKLTSLKQ